MVLIDKKIDDVAKQLDISPSDFILAKERYEAVSDWLKKGTYVTGARPEVYLQGSFRLGTVIKPFRDGKDAAFDIDQVCEIREPVSTSTADGLKSDIGDRLKSNATYKNMLDDEGRRCWTLEYAVGANRPAFHIDVLPARYTPLGNEGSIDITEKVKESGVYKWLSSNPKGYYYWFKQKNTFSYDFLQIQQKEIFAANRDLFQTEAEVPKRLVRTPLQRAIQIMKRHRDVYFAEKENAPISIILTTLCAHVYQGGGIMATLKQFTNYVIERHRCKIKGDQFFDDGYLDYYDGRWLILNPADKGRADGKIENFADKWNEDSALPQAFFNWVYQLNRTLRRFESSGKEIDLDLEIAATNDNGDFPNNLIQDMRHSHSTARIDHTDKLLDAIHLGIEGKVAWEPVEKYAKGIFHNTNDAVSKDIARVNYYQISLHQGRRLSFDARADIERVLDRRSDSPAFVLCCNILLERAVPEMLESCVKTSHGADAASWPILRLTDL